MKQRLLLDCTLRDGGYINDWNFGHSVLTGTYKRLDTASLDFIEIGFLDDRFPFDLNCSIMPNTAAINEIYGKIKKNNAEAVAMIDYGTCSLENIEQHNANSFIDGIRVIFKKEKIAEALPFCQAIKDKGYKLFIQAVSITSYNDNELLNYIHQINKIKPYAFSIVDTYGLLDENILLHYFTLIDQNLDLSIKLGYHGHNNFQLGFINSVKFLSMDTERDLIADSTVYGMGKSAGNCPTELLALKMNQLEGKSYDLNYILEIIDTDLLTIYQKYHWGYKYNFYISAMQKCHPLYVEYLLNKKTLSISSINTILSTLPENKKLLYDRAWIENAYIQHQNNVIDDTLSLNAFAKKINEKKILLLGPGKNIVQAREKILQSINDNQFEVIAVNFYDDIIPISYVFMSNSKRYSKLTDMTNSNKIDADLILTSNIEILDHNPEYVINYESLLGKTCNHNDNSLIMCLNLLLRMDKREVWLAGFDGYDNNNCDYFDKQYMFTIEHQSEFNELMKQDLMSFAEKLQIKFVTPSKYEWV